MEENLHYFEALGKKLIYDPQTLFCFGLPDSEYKHLNDNMTREELNKRLSAAQANTLSKNASSGNTPPTFRLKPMLCGITLVLTTDCNMKCIYCYENSIDTFESQPLSMDLPCVIDSIDWALQYSSNNETFTVALFGGEPLFKLSLITQLCNHYKNSHKNIRFTATTNGTIFTEEVKNLLKNHPFYLTVSVDGPIAQSITRPLKNGKSSTKLIEHNLIEMLSIAPDRIAVNTVLSHQNTNYLDSYTYFNNLKVLTHIVTPVASKSEALYLSHSDILKILKDSKTICQILLDALRNNTYYTLPSFLGSIYQLYPQTHNTMHCGACTGSLSISANRNTYLCHRFCDTNGFGKYSTISSKQLLGIQNLTISNHKFSQCNDCWAYSLCRGGCFHERYICGEKIADICFLRKGWLELSLAFYYIVFQTMPEKLNLLLEKCCTQSPIRAMELL